MRNRSRSAVRVAGQWLGAGLLVLLSGCESGGPMKIQTHWSPGVAFSEIGSTFDLAPLPAPREGGQPTVPPDLDAGLRRTIEEGFVARGYRPQTPPDFSIRYWVTKTKQGDPEGPGGIQEYEEGSLVVDVLKPESKRRLWRGWARARLNESTNPAERQERIRSAVERLLKDFPAAKP